MADSFQICQGAEHLSRAQRRQMKKLAARVEKITDADRKFFERFPHRQHRVRLAGSAEIEQKALMHGHATERLPPGRSYYAIIKNIVPGSQLRMIVVGKEGWDTKLSEQAARERFEAERTAQVTLVEQEMIELGRNRGLGACNA
ncbi:hypothetical protein MTR72_24395 [Bradyrhizobium sp. ISRA442]|uniref:hypothetical protein n=1 Tax=Bradyrhizobium sp. ISRA442 TaxID=2866197 RepID=UPI00311B130B